VSTTEDEKTLAAEREHTERLSQAHQAVARAQERSYWLDRWRIDLNALMQRPLAARLLGLLRTARIARATAIETKGKLSRAHAQGETGPADLTDLPTDRFRRTFSPRPATTAPVTEALAARLTDDDLAAVEAAVDGEQKAVLAGATDVDRLRMTLAFGIHHEIPGVLEHSGLTNAAPPASVHSMGRGAAAAGGSAYYADLVVDALETAGVALDEGDRVLDFGCSSGRVVRVLAAAHPGCEWLGCDPIPDAVEWAATNLPGIEFEQSPEEPPLPYSDASLDVAYAISIWSHFDAPAGLRWLEEMHRVIRPGGALLMTTHGFHTIAHDLAAGRRGAEQLEEVRDALYRDGFWFKDEFGDRGDHGVGGAEWGTAFLTPEWLAWHIAPRWKMSAFAPGRVEDNQDVYVLERR